MLVIYVHILKKTWQKCCIQHYTLLTSFLQVVNLEFFPSPTRNLICIHFKPDILPMAVTQS